MVPAVLRERAPLLIAVLVLASVAAVLVQRGQAREVTSPFVQTEAERPLLMADAAENSYEITVLVREVCAPGSDEVTISEVTLFGVAGSLDLAGYAPHTITARCDVDDSEELVVRVRRDQGESAHADGVVVAYEVDGEEKTERVPVAVTLCRQLSEC